MPRLPTWRLPRIINETIHRALHPMSSSVRLPISVRQTDAMRRGKHPSGDVKQRETCTFVGLTVRYCRNVLHYGNDEVVTLNMSMGHCENEETGTSANLST